MGPAGCRPSRGPFGDVVLASVLVWANTYNTYNTYKYTYIHIHTHTDDTCTYTQHTCIIHTIHKKYIHIYLTEKSQ